MDPLGLVFIPVGVALIYYGVPATRDSAVRRRRVDDEKRRDLITRGGTRFGDPGESRAKAEGWVALVLGIAFVLGGLSVLF